jgi:hypothetical protein
MYTCTCTCMHTHTYAHVTAWAMDIVMLYPLDELCSAECIKNLNLRADIMMACTCELFHHRFYCPHTILYTMAYQDSINMLNPVLNPKRGRDR